MPLLKDVVSSHVSAALSGLHLNMVSYPQPTRWRTVTLTPAYSTATPFKLPVLT